MTKYYQGIRSVVQA